MFKLYGFFNAKGQVIDKVPSVDVDRAKEIFERDNPDTEYMYVEVVFPKNEDMTE